MGFRGWLLLVEASQQETQALKILGGDAGVLGRLKSISPEPKFLPVLALLHKEQPELGQLGRDWAAYKRLLDQKKMPPLTVQGGRVLVPPQNQPITYLQWTEKVHAMSGDAELVRNRMDIDYSQWKPPIFKSEDLEVYETDGPGDCIRYGKGYSFCISQVGNTMWQRYRDTKTSTFYFVYDKSRKKDDPLHIVVVDINDHGPELTDAGNSTGNVAEYGADPNAYLEHLHKRGVPRGLFRNRHKTDEEQEESRLLGGQNGDLDWFKKLSPDHKSKYIGRGHELSDEQFDFIFENGLDSLAKQYAELGMRLNKHQMKKMLNSKFKNTYLHFRMISNENTEDISLEEYKSLREDQKKRFGPKSMVRMLVEEGDIDGANKQISSLGNFGGRLSGNIRNGLRFKFEEEVGSEYEDGIDLLYLFAEENFRAANDLEEGNDSVFSLYHFPSPIGDAWYELEDSTNSEQIAESIMYVRDALVRFCAGLCDRVMEGMDGLYVLQIDGRAKLLFTDCDDGCTGADGCYGPWMNGCGTPPAVFAKAVKFAEKHIDMDCHAEDIRMVQD
jgi:hypothetical protein